MIVMELTRRPFPVASTERSVFKHKKRKSNVVFVFCSICRAWMVRWEVFVEEPRKIRAFLPAGSRKADAKGTFLRRIDFCGFWLKRVKPPLKVTGRGLIRRRLEGLPLQKKGRGGIPPLSANCDWC